MAGLAMRLKTKEKGADEVRKERLGRKWEPRGANYRLIVLFEAL